MQRFRLPGRDEVPVGVGGKRRAGYRRGKGGEGWATMVWTRWSTRELLCVYERLSSRGFLEDPSVTLLFLFPVRTFLVSCLSYSFPYTVYLVCAYHTTVFPLIFTGTRSRLPRQNPVNSYDYFHRQPSKPLPKAPQAERRGSSSQPECFIRPTSFQYELAGEAEEARDAFPALRDPTPTCIPSGTQPA